MLERSAVPEYLSLTYRVVAFMVTVRLVEKRVYNKVGTEIVASLMA